MSSFERDVVIVGGGHNGLACAAYLARAGLDVLVLERRDVLGGAAVTEEPWPGYKISSASYVVSLMPQRVVQELELKRFGYDVSIISPDYFCPFPGGTSLTLWGDLARDCENIAKFSTARRRRVREVRRVLRARRGPDEGAAVRRAAEHGARRRRELGAHGRAVPPVDRPRRLRARSPLHDERVGLPRRVVRGRTGEGRDGDPGDHRRVVRSHDSGLRLRAHAPLDRRHRRAFRRLGMGQGRHGRLGLGDGRVRAGTRRRDPYRRARRARRRERTGACGRRGARGRNDDPGQARRVERASEDHVPRPRRRGAPFRADAPPTSSASARVRVR